MYIADKERYSKMAYNKCGDSGLKLPRISLGLWHNFGYVNELENCREMLKTAFDLGITHFDLANNYGPPPGSAEENFGRILKMDFLPYRDELVISTKAGYEMWDGPYGNFGSKKYLVSSLDQSLKRMGLDYVDIFYHHRPDPDTPLEETACAMDLIVRQGKALYVGVSNYSSEQTFRITKIFSELKTPFIIHQPRYNMLDRWVEDGLTDVLKKTGTGCIAFSPLAQGLLTDRYSRGIPADSRAALGKFLKPEQVETYAAQVAELSDLAKDRGQKLAQMAVSWLLAKGVTSVLVGASSSKQIKENAEAQKNILFTAEEFERIDRILGFNKGE